MVLQGGAGRPQTPHCPIMPPWVGNHGETNTGPYILCLVMVDPCLLSLSARDISFNLQSTRGAACISYLLGHVHPPVTTCSGNFLVSLHLINTHSSCPCQHTTLFRYLTGLLLRQKSGCPAWQCLLWAF